MIEYKIRMNVTSSDLEEMAKRARELETTARLGEDLTIRDWYDGNITVHLVVDQDRARRKGLMQ